MADWARLSIEAATEQLCAPGSPFEVETAEIRGVSQRVWANGPRDLRSVLERGRTFGDLPFLIFADETASFEGFARAVAHAAVELQRRDVRPGDRVALVMSNRPEWCVAFLATVCLNAIAVPLNSWWTAGELEFALADVEPRLVLVDPERLDRLAGPAADRWPTVVAGTGVPERPGLGSMHDWIGPLGSWDALPDVALPVAEIDPEDPATIFFTSGTTGRPKGAVGTHRSSVAVLTGMAFSGARLQARGGPVPTPPGRRGTLLSVPLFHVTGSLSRFLPALYTGGKLVMMPRWDAAEAARLIRSEELTATGGVPTIALQLMDHLAQNGESVPSLTSLSWGGAPVSPAIVERVTTELPGVVAGTGFGMTEAASMITHHQGMEYRDAPDSVGLPMPICELQVWAQDGTPCPVGTVGELVCRGSNVLVEYWRRPEETAEALRGGWLRTGDLAYLDDHGRCYVVDRIKDVVIRGGENIYSLEVENALVAIDGVLEAALLGAPHPTLGEVPVAVVFAPSLGPDLTPDLDETLRARLVGVLASVKIPVRIYLHPGPLPRNENGKVVKPALKAAYL